LHLGPDLAEGFGVVLEVVLHKGGVLINGRNRLATCNLAGVEPTFTTLNGHDPVAFIISADVNRRHLTEGQRAIAVVRARCFNLKQDGADARSLASDSGVNLGRIGQALVIVEHAPDLADEVMAGTRPSSTVHLSQIS
jgi:hypothetical protein